MTHDELRGLLPMAAAGLLDLEEERLVIEHVRECATCTSELDAWVELGTGMRALPAPGPPPELLARTHAAVMTEIEIHRRKRAQSMVLIAAALFSWTLTLLSVEFFRWVAGGSAVMWWIVSTLVSWAGGGVAAVVMAQRRAAQRRLCESF